MKPVKHAGADVVYRGPTPDIGDLWCFRDRPGLIRVVRARRAPVEDDPEQDPERGGDDAAH
jgi:hypothetical protein